MTQSATNRRVLVVDDQESIREDFRKILGAGDASRSSALHRARSAFFSEEEARHELPTFELTLAAQGLEGIQALERNLSEGLPFALAFVDVRMPPGIDGLNTIQELWARDPHLQVVICTAYSDYSLEQITELFGATDRLLVLKKPFDPVEVRQIACALTEKWSAARREADQLRALREANLRAEEASRAKSEFLANMSHEIRTPMNAILGYVDLLCEAGTTAEERTRYVTTIRNSGEHLLTLLNDILDLSRIEAARLDVQPAPFSPAELAREIVDLFATGARERGLSLVLEVDAATPAAIESDPHRVRQVLINLVGNALKFTHQGGVRVVVRPERAPAVAPRLRFEVIDSGIGVEPSQIEAIFEPFNQADTSSTREYGGAGLGLTIAKRLAELLGGEIEVESARGKGSLFSLCLPQAAVALRPADPASPASGASLVASPARGASALASAEALPAARGLALRCLVVEDVKFNQLLIGAFLRKAGASVTLAGDGREGLERVRAAEARGEPFDLVLMDMQMPVMDGYEATRRLRAAGFTRPIVAVTAHAMAGDREKCLQAGCSEYLTKPVDRNRLLAVCRRLHDLESRTAPVPSSERAPVAPDGPDGPEGRGPRPR
jgi:two-component system sensor histidine kinase/response regulator